MGKYTEHKNKKKEILKKMQDIVGGDFATTDPEIGITYSYDMLAGVDYLGRGREYFMPDYVVLPQTVAQVQKLIRLANEYLIPVYFCSQRTNIGGLTNPAEGGMIMDTHKMNKILEVNEDMMTITVEPGVCFGEAMKAAADHDLYLPGILGPFGGSLVGSYMCANMGHYGGFGFTDMITSLEMVSGTGDIIRTGGASMMGQAENGKYFRNPLGSQLTELFRQSQGQLGCITKLTHRLWPMPEAQEHMLIGFDKIEDLVSFVKNVERRRIIACLAIENRECLEIYTVPDMEILKSRERYLEYRKKINEIFTPFHVKLCLQGTREIVDIYKKYVLEDAAKFKGKEIHLPDWIAKDFPEFCRGATWLACRMYTHVCSPIGAMAPWYNVAKSHYLGEEMTSKMDLKNTPYTDEPARIKRVMIPLERGTYWEIEWDACIDHDDPKKNQRFIMELMMRALGELNCYSVVSAPHLEMAEDPTFVKYMRKIKEICDPNRVLARGYSR